MLNEDLVVEELDPRVRRTRQLLQTALAALLQEKPFDELSITDIAKRADLARVTFYQHYASKEALLLTLVSDFFAQMYGVWNKAMFQQFMASGQLEDATQLIPSTSPDPAQLQFIRVALEHTGTAVREMAINSFLQAFAHSNLFTTDTEARLVATYHVSGMLALLEAYLRGELAMSAATFQTATLALMRLLFQEGAMAGVLHEALTMTNTSR